MLEDMSVMNSLKLLTKQQLINETSLKCANSAIGDKINSLVSENITAAAAVAVKKGDLRLRYNIWPGMCQYMELGHSYSKCGHRVNAPQVVFVDASSLSATSRSWCFQAWKFLSNQAVDEYNDELGRVAGINWCSK